MIFDNYNYPNANSYDVCIIGAGAAGITTALELDRCGLKVCLIESGSLKINKKLQDDFKNTNSGINYSPVRKQCKRVFGGTTSVWGGNCIPFDDIDFLSRKERLNFKWPISYDEINKYVERAQEVLKIDKNLFDEKLLQNFDLEYLQNKDFRMLAWQFCNFPFNFGAEYFDDLKNSKNICCYLNSSFKCFNKKNSKEIESACFYSASKNTFNIYAKKYILSCGGVGNTKLLLSVYESKIFPSINLSNNLGKYFTDHPVISIGYISGNKADKFFYKHSTKLVNGIEVKPGISLRKDIQKDEGILNGIISIWPVYDTNCSIYKVQSFLRDLKNKDLNLIDIFKFIKIFKYSFSLFKPFFNRYFYKNKIYSRVKKNIYEVILMLETIPNKSSSITLTEEKDSLGLKNLNINWVLSSKDRTNLIHFTKKFENYISNYSDIKFKQANWIYDHNIDWCYYLNLNNHHGHHMGTTIMHNDPKNGVVDNNCKVHGLANLYVNGSSVFPTFSFANPTLTIVALALRIADHINKDLKSIPK